MTKWCIRDRTSWWGPGRNDEWRRREAWGGRGGRCTGQSAGSRVAGPGRGSRLHPASPPKGPAQDSGRSCASPPCPGEPHRFSAAVSSVLTFQLNEKCVRGVRVPRVTGCCDKMPPPGQLQQQAFGGRDLRQGHRWLRFQQEASSGFSRVLVGWVPSDSGDSVSALTRAPVLWDRDPALVTSCHPTSVRARSPRAHTLGVEGQGFTLRLSRVQSHPWPGLGRSESQGDHLVHPLDGPRSRPGLSPGPAGLLPPAPRGQAHRHRADARTRAWARSAWTPVCVLRQGGGSWGRGCGWKRASGPLGASGLNAQTLHGGPSDLRGSPSCKSAVSRPYVPLEGHARCPNSESSHRPAATK